MHQILHYRTRFIFLLITIILFSVPSLCWGSDVVHASIMPSSAVAHVNTYDAQGKILAQGNGFFISDSRFGTQSPVCLVTLRHFFLGAHHAALTLADGTSFAIRDVLADDAIADLLVVSADVPMRLIHPIPLTSKLLPEQAKIRMCDAGGVTGEGIVMHVEDNPRPGCHLSRISIPIPPSGGGSPLLDEQGAIMGMTLFSLAEGKDMNLALSLRDIAILQPAHQRAPLTKWIAHAEAQWADSSAQLFLTASAWISFEQDHQRALPLALRAVQLSPHDEENQFLLARCYFHLSKFELGITSSQEAILLDPRNDFAYVLLGMSQFYSNLPVAAVTSLQEAIRLNPRNESAFFGLALVYDQAGHLPQAISSALKAASLDPMDMDVLTLLAQFGHALGNDAKTLQALQQMSQHDTRNNTFYQTLGIAYVETDNNQQAVSALMHADQLDPNNAITLYYLGRAYTGMRKYDAAIRVCQQNENLHPDVFFVTFEFAKALFNVKRFHDAQDMITKSMRQAKTANTYYLLGEIDIQLKQFADARTALTQSVQMEPHDVAVWQALGETNVNIGDDAAAIAAYEQGLQYDHKNYVISCELSDVYHSLTQYDKALAVLTPLTLDYPNDANVYIHIALMNFGLLRYADAGAAAAKAIALDPQCADAYCFLATADMGQGLFSDAIQVSRRGLATVGNYPQFHLELGGAYLFLNDRDAANREYHILMDQNQEMAAALLALIKAYDAMPDHTQGNEDTSSHNPAPIRLPIDMTNWIVKH